MNKLSERVIRNWITTVIGIAIAVVAIIMWYNGKLDTLNLLTVAPVVFSFVWVKHSFFKKTV